MQRRIPAKQLNPTIIVVTLNLVKSQLSEESGAWCVVRELILDF